MTKKSKSGNASKKRAPANAKAQTDNMSLSATPIQNLQAESAAAIVDQVEEATTMDIKVIVKQETESTLLKLPAEIKQKIWSLAITEDESIEPFQIGERSNKFIWSKAQIENLVGSRRRVVVKNAAQLTVVALSKVCRTLYEEVSLTHLFYKVNNFDFGLSARTTGVGGAINYLVALTTPRMKSLRSLTCEWPIQPKEAQKLFTVLAACGGLQNLKLILTFSFLWHNHSSEVNKLPGFKYALIAAEGLQTLQVQPPTIITYDPTLISKTQAEAMVDKVKSALEVQMKLTRGTSKYSLEKYLEAQREAKLDIHGDGRLGEDKKPGIIASRTRNQLRKLETLRDDGTIPKRVLPKYDSDGDLAWHIETILESRRSEPDGYPPSVEFKVKCHALTGLHSWQRTDLPAETSWEDIAVLQNFRHNVYAFYEKNPNAYGKEAVVEAWNLRDKESDKPTRELIHLGAWTTHIIKIIQREEKLERIRVEQAAKDAANATREAKKLSKRAKGTKAAKSNC